MSICIQTRQLQWLVTMIYTATLIQDTWQIDSYNSISPWFMWDVSSMLIVDLVGYYALSMYMIFSTHATTFNLRWLSHVAVVQQLSGTGEFRLVLELQFAAISFHNWQSWRMSILGPSPGWKHLLAFSHLRHYQDTMLNRRWPTVSQREIGSETQKSKGTGGLVSIVSYSRPSLMIIASRIQFHVERPWGQRPFSIVS